MELADLVARCVAAAAEKRDVQLVVPHETRGQSVRLFGRIGPRSREIACVTDRGTVAWWDPTAVLSWLVRRGIIEFTPGGKIKVHRDL